MAGLTNRGKARLLEMVFRRLYNGGALPGHFYVALVTDAAAPGPDTNVLGDLTEIAAGNGYAAYELTPGVADFDMLQEDDGNDRGRIQIADVVWTASGGPIPASGDGARYVVLTDDHDHATEREVLAWWDLGSVATVGDGQTLTLEDLELRLDDVS